MPDSRNTEPHRDDDPNTSHGASSTELPEPSQIDYFSSWKHTLLTLGVTVLIVLVAPIWLFTFVSEVFELGAPRCRCMQGIIIRPGIHSYLVKTWFGTAGFVLLANLIDFRRSKSRPFKNRLFISAAIFATTTFAIVGYYGATVDSEEWRIFTDDGGLSDPEAFHRNMGSTSIIGDVVFD